MASGVQDLTQQRHTKVDGVQAAEVKNLPIVHPRRHCRGADAMGISRDEGQSPVEKITHEMVEGSVSLAE